LPTEGDGCHRLLRRAVVAAVPEQGVGPQSY
jgi:hypothetical protein